VFAHDLRTRVSRTRNLVVAALDHQFGARKEFVVSCMVRVEVRANEIVDIVGLQANGSKLIHDIIFRAHFQLEIQRSLRTWRVIDETVRVSGIDENVRAVIALNKVSRHRHTQRLQKTELQQI